MTEKSQRERYAHVSILGLRLGELLVKMSLIRPEQLEEALKAQRQFGGKLGETLVTMGFLTEQDIVKAMSRKFGIPLVDLETVEIEEQWSGLSRPTSRGAITSCR